MAANAIKTQGTKLEIKTGTSAYTAIKGFKDFSGLGGGSAAVIDTTDLDSTAKEKAMGLPDEGQVSINLLYLPKDAGQVALAAARGTQAATGFRITLSDGSRFEYNAYVLSYGKDGSSDDVVTASSTLEVTGAITFTAGA